MKYRTLPPFAAVSVSLQTLLLLAALCHTASAQTREAPTSPSRPDLVLQSGHSDAIGALAFSHDGRLLASGGADQRVVLWDTESGRPRYYRSKTLHHLPPSQIDFFLSQLRKKLTVIRPQQSARGAAPFIDYEVRVDLTEVPCR